MGMQEPQKKKRFLHFYVCIWQMHSVYTFYTMCQVFSNVLFLYSCWSHMVLKNHFQTSFNLMSCLTNNYSIFSLHFESTHIIILIFKTFFYIIFSIKYFYLKYFSSYFLIIMNYFFSYK